ncbi:hypothetical protein ACROYT_G008985 [Oculina patagonica]
MEGLEVSHAHWPQRKNLLEREHTEAIFVMGFPEDKVRLLEDDNQETHPPTVLDVNEYEGSSRVCRVLCVSLTYVVVLGVFLTSFAYHSSSSDEDSHSYIKGYNSHVSKLRPSEDYRDEMHDFRMQEEQRRMKMSLVFRSWSKPSKTYDPPPRFEKAKTARYIVHNSDWGSISTISVSMDGAPFGMAASFSDGTVDNSTGVPYFYLAKYDPVMKNMESNALSSLSLSEAQSGYCKEHNWDPEEPLCSRVTVIGKVSHFKAFNLQVKIDIG